MPINMQQIDDRTRLLTFKEQASVFPLCVEEDEVFYSKQVVEQYPQENLPSCDDAQEQGYAIAAYLLKNPAINNVVLSVDDKGQDIVVVKVQNGFSWQDEKLKLILRHLEKEFCESGRPLYMDPDTIDPQNVVQKINDYFKGPKDPAHAGVFRTIKNDEGAIRAVAFKAGTATLAFSGACSSNCSNGDTSVTQSGLTAAVRRNIPEVMHCKFILD